MEKHYVEFRYHGIMFSETSVQEVESRDHTNIQAPSDCYGFRFFDIPEKGKNGNDIGCNRKNVSGTFYFGKAVKTLDEIKDELPESDVLNVMEINGWEQVIKTRCGNYRPFSVEDIVLAEK